MRRWFANATLVGLGLALPLLAFGQVTSIPVIPALSQPETHAKHVKKGVLSDPLWWQPGGDGVLSLSTAGGGGTAVPSVAPFDGQSHSAHAGLHLTTEPGLTAHAELHATGWAPLQSLCAAAVPGSPTNSACVTPLVEGLQRGEVGAGYAHGGMKFDLSLGRSQSETITSSALNREVILPRVLPAEGGADVAAPLWFRNSTSTNISAHGQLDLAPGTNLDLGASVGHVRLLPGAGLTGNDTLNQTTLSLGLSHGAIRGAIVGHMLEPDLPNAGLNPNPLESDRHWSGIDLGISVRLPWSGELNFGTQNVWSSGRAPLLFKHGGVAPDQGRVPYVQYHQDL